MRVIKGCTAAEERVKLMEHTVTEYHKEESQIELLI